MEAVTQLCTDRQLVPIMHGYQNALLQVGVFLCAPCQFGTVLQRCITPCYYIACAFVQTSGSFGVQKIYFNHVYKRNLNNNAKIFQNLEIEN